MLWKRKDVIMATQLLSTKPYKGTRDFYPADMKLRNWFFGKIRSVLELAAFEEYNGPMLESLETCKWCSQSRPHPWT